MELIRNPKEFAQFNSNERFSGAFGGFEKPPEEYPFYVEAVFESGPQYEDEFSTYRFDYYTAATLTKLLMDLY